MVRIFIFFALFLSACGSVGGLNLGQYADPSASPNSFTVCHGYGCTQKTVIGFHPEEWQSVRNIFNQESPTPEIERQKIGQAIALIEHYVGALVGTKDDLPKAPLIRTSDTEQDCIDETVNTTKYLRFLEDDRLLKFHIVDQPIYKGFMLDGVYPHNSASIKEIQTGNIYVVDSYIYQNAVAPDIRSLESWLKYRSEDLPKTANLKP